MSRRVRLLVLLVPVLLLIAATIAAVPYRIDEEHVNRRTGATSRTTVIALASRSEPSIRQDEDLAMYGTLTAPDEWLLVGKTVYPFPWSRVSMPNHWRAESNLNHWSLKIMKRVLFGMARDSRPLANEPRMTDQQFAELMAKRLDIWNSLTVDYSLQELDRQIREENERLFPGAVKPKIHVATITTVVSTVPADSAPTAGHFGIVIDGGFDGQRPLDESALAAVLGMLATEKEKTPEASLPDASPMEELQYASPRPTSTIMVYDAAPVNGGKYSAEDKMTAQVLYFAEAGLVTWSDRSGDPKAGGTRNQGVVKKVKELCAEK